MTTTLEKVGLAICSPTGHVPCKEVCGECSRRARAAIQALMDHGGKGSYWDCRLQAILDEQKETA